MDPVNFQFSDPSAAILNGIKTSAVLGQMQQQAQQQQLAQQRAVQQQAMLNQLATNPDASHADYSRVMTMFPELAENLGKSFNVLNEGQKQNLLNFQTRAYAAQLAGNTDLAAQMFEDRAKAETNPQEAAHSTMMANLIRQAPSQARAISALGLAGALGPEKFATAFPALGQEARAAEQAPADLLKKQAEAATAVSTSGIKAVEAQNAPTATVLANEKDRQTILSADAQRQVANFNAQIAAANSETQRGQLTLERDKFIADQKLKTSTAAQDSQNQLDTLGQSLDLVGSLRKDLADPKKWTLVGSTVGKGLGVVPGTDAKDFRAKIDTLKSQQFLTQAKEMKGMGALSDAEGARIERAVASLDPDQSPEAFSNALGVIETTLRKGQAKLIAMGKLPKDGGAFVMRHPVYGNVGEGDINRLMAQNPGSTREQVIQYLRSTGGK